MTGGTIMVVDDDPAVLKSLERVLSAENYQVVCCPSAHGAIDRIATEPPDVILLDLLMPKMNGRQFLETLRAQLRMTDIPVIMITGVRGIDLKQANSMGASDVIEKPFNIEQLLNKLALVRFRSQKHLEGVDEEGKVRPVPTRRTGEFSLARIQAQMEASTVVLISEDEALKQRVQAMADSTARRLVALGRVTEELPRVVRALRPRAVLVDLHVPGTGGMAVVRQLRGKRVLDRLPLMIIANELEGLDRARDELATLAVASLLQPFEDDDILSFLANPPASASRGARAPTG